MSDRIKVADLALKVLSVLVIPLFLWALNLHTNHALLKSDVLRLQTQLKALGEKEDKLIEKLNDQVNKLAVLTAKLDDVKEDTDELRKKYGK